MDLLQQIDYWGKAASNRVAHISTGRTLTYGELVSYSDTLAAYLAQALPPDRSPIAIYGHKEPEMLIAFLAAVKAGHPYVPIDTVQPLARAERIVQAAGARLLLTPEEVATRVSDGPAQVPDPACRVGTDDPFYVLFTSGSTGDPKGVIITLGCLQSFVAWMLAEHSPGEGEIFLNQAPFSFDLSVMDLYTSLASGSTLFSITRDQISNTAELFRVLPGSGLTTWVSTPSFARLCLAEPSFSTSMLPRLRRFLFCGETLSPDVAANLLDRFPAAEVWNTYGPTEATVATTSVRIDREMLTRYPALPIGYPKPDSRILIVDEERRPLPPGVSGEIVISGPHVSLGYIGRPDLTAKAFYELDGARAYRTGDLGHYRDGLLFFEGRADNQIKLAGYRIELGDVEANLQALPGIRDAVVLPRTRDGVVDALTAFVILVKPPDGSEFEIASLLRTQLAQRLPVYMLPRKFHFLPAFPMTSNGKVDRRKLAELIR